MSEGAAAHRVLVLAPVGRDAELMCDRLRRAGIACESCPDVDALRRELEAGAGALLLTEEALTPAVTRTLVAALGKQPPWSDVPLLVLTGLPSLDVKARSFRELRGVTNVTFLDRPLRIQSLISAAQAALRARQRQYEVRDLMTALEDRVRERDRFLAILGHELRNPLGAILLASQMVDPEGKIGAEHARLIERQSRHLTRIVNDLLDLSRVVSGKIVIKTEPVDLGVVATQALDTLRESAARQEVSVELHIPEQPLVVAADPVRVDQILTNILSNAIKYTPAGGHVTVSMEREEGEGVVRVRDDGVGIAPERMETIFELFQQAENAIGRSQGGMGIGLALVRNLVELQGGSVSARSDGVGKGSEFTIRLPLAAEGAGAAVARERPAVVAGEGGAARRIVIVEDNADVRELLRLKLHRLGHEVEAVGDGLAGVRTIVDTRPDLALVDIGLPHLDGYQVASRVREQIGDGVMLVAVSGFGQPEDKRRAVEAGFDEHITKPADVHDIESLLARISGRERNASEV